MKSPLSIYLKGHGETQTAFALRTGWRQATISGWCNGIIPSIPLALEIERATSGEVSVNDWASYATETNKTFPQDNTPERNNQASRKLKATRAGEAA